MQIAPPHYNRSGTFAGRADRTSRTLSALDGAVKHYCVETLMEQTVIAALLYPGFFSGQKVLVALNCQEGGMQIM